MDAGRNGGDQPVCRIALAGLGDIAPQYLNAIRAGQWGTVVAATTRDPARGQAFAAAHGVPVRPLDAILADPDIDLVVNLSAPAAHADLSRRALAAGKHVYMEKPLALDLASAAGLIAEAGERRRVLGCAPATFLGETWQAVQALLAGGQLGTVTGVHGAMVYPGPRLFHPNPVPFYGPGAGPLFDMGVYHLTMLVWLFGPITRVQALARTDHRPRAIVSGPQAGERFCATAPSHYVILLEFESGLPASLICSFDGFGSRAPGLEIVGDRASLAAPQPSQFEGALHLSEQLFAWRALRPAPAAPDPSQLAAGVRACWQTARDGTALPVDPKRAYHVLAAMCAIERAAREATVERVAQFGR